MDDRPLPPPAPTQAEDDSLFALEPCVIPPIRAEYGFNIRLGEASWVNWNAVFCDCTPVTIGARTLVGPNCSFFGGSHHLDPFVRDGDLGPWFEKPITVEDDCWLGGNVVLLPGVTIGRGSTVGAGSVVTKVWTVLVSNEGILSIDGGFVRMYRLSMSLLVTRRG